MNAVAGRTLGTSTNEDDCGGKQEDGGAQATFRMSTGAGTDRGKDGLHDGSSRR
jgi:hypothetical protein